MTQDTDGMVAVIHTAMTDEGIKHPDPFYWLPWVKRALALAHAIGHTEGWDSRARTGEALKMLEHAHESFDSVVASVISMSRDTADLLNMIEQDLRAEQTTKREAAEALHKIAETLRDGAANISEST